MADPYADLSRNLAARKRDYLFRLTTDQRTFDTDPEKNGVAKRRGYLKRWPERPQALQAPRPQCKVLDQDNAAIAADDDHHLVVWTDSPCYRAYVGDPWEGEDVRSAIARLTVFSDPQAFADAIPIPDPPSEMATGIRFRSVVNLLRQLSLTNRHAFHSRIRGLLGPGLVIVSSGPPLSGVPPLPEELEVFDSNLVAFVVESLDSNSDPDIGDQAKLYELTNELAVLTLENEATPVGTQRAHDLLIGLYRLLGNDIVIDLVSAVLQRSVVIEGPLTSSPGPHVPAFVWLGLATLSQFGRYEIDSPSLRNTILCLAQWLKAGTGLPPATVSDVQTHGPKGGGLRSPVEGFTTLFEALFRQEAWGDVFWPPGFKLPDFDRKGIYWWQSVIIPQCINCFLLNETADFHSTDLIRFLFLFPAPDERIPDYVRTAAELALVWFKYWWDEPPAKNPDNSDKAEMTMWSENHQILFAQSQLLAGALFRDREFPRTGDVGNGKNRTGQDHVKEGLARVERWLDHRLSFGFSEWNAPGYYNEDLPPLFNLVDFTDAAATNATDDRERQAFARVKIKAAMVVDLIVFDFARFTCRGSFGVTAGRAYWEHKAYGWEQSIGNTIEILFGTRGDFMDTEPAAVALATSSYEVPEALLAIGLDRRVLDRSQPFNDRTRVSVNFDDAPRFGIGFDSEEDVLFWWGLEAFYTDHTLESTKRVVQAHDNLRLCDPFEPLYVISGGWLKGWLLQTILRIGVDFASSILDVFQATGGAALGVVLPFPFDLIAVGGVVDILKDAWDMIKTVGKAIGHLLGLGDDEPDIPDTVLQQILEKILVAFTQGTVLSRANMVTYNNGDAMLSSVQNHLVGLMAFQKQPWMASLGCEACVWTQARMMSPDLSSYTDAAERFIKDIGMLHVHEAVLDILEPPGAQIVKALKGDPFGHDGPNYWTGSLALPMIVQHENAAIIAYNVPSFQRAISGASTHAWFPKLMFDETSKQDANGGAWFFGRKDHFDPDPKSGDPVLVGSGYVALFTARNADWTNEPGNNWNDKEIMAERGSNIWVCVVGNKRQFSDFETFRKEVLSAYLNISGVGSLTTSLSCSFDIPRATAPPGKTPRLELFYDDRIGRFAGESLVLDFFPRLENRYVEPAVEPPIPLAPTRIFGPGRAPQTQRAVDFGARAYVIKHPPTGLKLVHNLNPSPLLSRTFNSQEDQQILDKLGAQRLMDGSLTTARRSRLRASQPHPLHHPTLPHLRDG